MPISIENMVRSKSFLLKFKLGIFLLTMFYFSCFTVKAQVKVTNIGEKITITNGSLIYINGSYLNKSGEETDFVKGGVIASGGNSKFIVTDTIGNFNEEKLEYSREEIRHMIMGDLEVIVKGELPQKVVGTTDIHFFQLTVDKEADSLKLVRNFQVNDTLQIVQGNIHLNHNQIFLDRTNLVKRGILFGERPNHKIADYRKGRGIIYTKIPNFNPAGAGNIAGLGIHLDGGGTLLGLTQIARGHGKQGGPSVEDGGPGIGSILRYYQIKPEIPQSIPSAKMNYFGSELDGHKQEELNFWSSQVSEFGPGVRWERMGGEGNVTDNSFSIEDLYLENTRFTLAPFVCTNLPVISFPSYEVHVCEGLDSILDAGNPGMIFKWSTGETTQKIKVKEEGKYLVRVQDAKGCASFDSVLVVKVKPPHASLTVSTVCLHDTTKFFSQSTPGEVGLLNHLWKFGVPDKFSKAKDTAYVYSTAGEFEVSLEVTNKFGCTDDTSKKIIIAPLPTAEFAANSICTGKTVAFENKSKISSGGMSYWWEFGDGKTSELENPEHLFATSGTYNIRLIATSNGQCKDTISKVLESFPTPVAGFTSTGDCINETIQFNNTSSLAVGTLSYQWTFGDGTASQNNNPSKKYSTPRAYEVRLIAAAPNGCADTTLQRILVNNCNGVDCSLESPTVDLGEDQQLCDGQKIILDAGNPGNEYNWTEGSKTQTISVHSQGTYGVEVITPKGCVGYDEVLVNVTPRFTISLGSDLALCKTVNTLELTPKASKPGNYQYSWGSDQGISGNTIILRTDKPGKYWIVVNELSGCNFVAKDTIEIKPTTNSIRAAFLVKSSPVVGDPLVFVQLSHPNPVNFSWDFGDKTSSVESQPTHTYLATGRYKVLLTVDNGVCWDTLSKMIEAINPVFSNKEDSTSFIPGSPKDSPKTEEIQFVELVTPRVYPNPTSGAFHYSLELDKEAAVIIQIYTMKGLLITQRKAAGASIKELFDITGEGTGLYLIRTILNDQVAFNKILKF